MKNYSDTLLINYKLFIFVMKDLVYFR